MASISIFISYRRRDCAGHAGRLVDRLEREFGRHAVFRDIEDIEAGDDFAQTLNSRIDRCDVLLALIGERWLDSRDASGRRRIDQPNDWVRYEISRAMDRGIRVIPILFQGAHMPAATELPESISSLSRRNAFEIRDVQFERDVNALIQSLQPRSMRMLKRASWAAGLLVGLGLLGWGAYVYHLGGTQDRARARLAQLDQAFTAETFLEAVKHSDYRAVMLYLDAGMDVHTTNEAGTNAVQIAAASGDSTLVSELLKRGADASSALGVAMFNEDIAVLNLLLSHSLNQPALDSALGQAALSGDVDMMERLFKLGANPAHDGYVAVYDAVRAPSIASLDWLIEKGVDLKAVPARDNGDTLLLQAVRTSFSDTEPDPESVQLAIIQRLVESGVPINTRADVHSMAMETALLAAIFKKRERAAVYLLDHGAGIEDRVTGRHWSSYSPLLCAAEQGLDQVVAKLLALGADINARGEDQATALDRATYSGNVDVVNRLLAAGADPNLPGKEGWTPLMLAAYKDNQDMLEVLLAAGARADQADAKGNTSLMLAARGIRFDHRDTIVQLLAAGADPRARNAAGESAIDILRSRERHDLAALLEKS